MLRCHIGEVEALAAQAFVRAATEAQSHNGLALRCRKERERGKESESECESRSSLLSTHHGGALLALVGARKDVQRALCAGRMPLRALVDVHAPQVNVDARCASAKGERGSAECTWRGVKNLCY